MILEGGDEKKGKDKKIKEEEDSHDNFAQQGMYMTFRPSSREFYLAHAVVY